MNDWIPTSCKHLPRSRHHHYSAIWVIRNLIEESHHLTDKGGKKTSIQFNGEKNFNNKCLRVLIIFITLEIEGVKKEL